MNATEIARLDGLSVSIGQRNILRDVSFSVPAGACIALVGETGSGKSMTCRALSGLLERIGGQITAGDVAFAGRSVTAYRERDWRKLRGREVSLIPQSSLSSLNPVRTVRSQLREAIRVIDPANDNEEHLRELLDSVRLRDPDRVLRSYPHELSGGMRQRVMIAMALIGNPRLIIADEPTTALDVVVQRDILALISELQRSRGVTVASHAAASPLMSSMRGSGPDRFRARVSLYPRPRPTRRVRRTSRCAPPTLMSSSTSHDEHGRPEASRSDSGA